MGDMAEEFRAYDQHKKDKKESNKEYSTALLESNRIQFESKNGGYHLIIENEKEIIDFYPSTGKWIIRKGKSKRGIEKLINHIQRNKK